MPITKISVEARPSLEFQTSSVVVEYTLNGTETLEERNIITGELHKVATTKANEVLRDLISEKVKYENGGKAPAPKQQTITTPTKVESFKTTPIEDLAYNKNGKAIFSADRTHLTKQEVSKVLKAKDEGRTNKLPWTITDAELAQL